MAPKESHHDHHHHGAGRPAARTRRHERGPGYDDVRALFNAMIDKRPLLIARCVDAADVVACVEYARQEALEVAVRGGGHNGPGSAASTTGC
ncbi:hypothetical protein NKG05_13530 [Oerskovia sp. M15]